MAFPDIHTFPVAHPGKYERNMGRTIAGLLRLYHGRVPDPESAVRVGELAAAPDRWSAGHAVFREVRRRCLAAVEAKDSVRCRQYGFEELCCKALYNATSPRDPFDPSSPFSVAGAAVRLARAVGVPVEAVADVLAPEP
jgi:hypothetical protein